MLSHHRSHDRCGRRRESRPSPWPGRTPSPIPDTPPQTFPSAEPPGHNAPAPADLPDRQQSPEIFEYRRCSATHPASPESESAEPPASTKNSPPAKIAAYSDRPAPGHQSNSPLFWAALDEP